MAASSSSLASLALCLRSLLPLKDTNPTRRGDHQSWSFLAVVRIPTTWVRTRRRRGGWSGRGGGDGAGVAAELQALHVVGMHDDGGVELAHGGAAGGAPCLNRRREHSRRLIDHLDLSRTPSGLWIDQVHANHTALVDIKLTRRCYI